MSVFRWVVVAGFFACSFAGAQDEHSSHGAHGAHAAPTDHAAMGHSQRRGQISFLPADCGAQEIWDSVTAMCMPYPSGEPLTHWMLHGNVFGVGVAQSGPRGRDGWVSTQMFMGNLGRTLGERHFVNLGLMATLEKFTLPRAGYPLLLQTGEADRDGNPYIDGQHPHTTPVMGLTLSDTIRLGDGTGKRFLKLHFSPRGASTDGPIVFMHRPTGVSHPDAPLGHHIGQDAGHITSTVIGATLGSGDHQIEVSAFDGQEPEPDLVNLPVGAPDSAAARYTLRISDQWLGIASLAYVHEPHAHAHGGLTPSYDSGITHLVRYSLSAYSKHRLGEWDLFQTFIYGSYRTFGVDILRHSLAHEFLLQRSGSEIFGRAQVLERVPAELGLPGVASPLDGRWVAAFTLGYAHTLVDWGAARLALGASGTKHFLPGEFIGAYGGNPWAGRVFLRLGGMEMGAL